MRKEKWKHLLREIFMVKILEKSPKRNSGSHHFQSVSKRLNKYGEKAVKLPEEHVFFYFFCSGKNSV